MLPATARLPDMQTLIDQKAYQLDVYLAGLKQETDWLVIFDHRRGQPPISQRTRAVGAVTPAGRAVTVIRA